MSRLTVSGVEARHGRTPVLNGVDLAVERGEIVSVLGPSGCGKTTLLRTIAGHHRITAGTIRAEDVKLAGPKFHLPAERRSITVVPQEGGLFPHLDVSANIAFGLKRRWGREARRERVQEMLDLVGLTKEARRRPHEISGGQQQRVALARALAPNPAFVLLDEPFSALDAQLREDLRTEVKALLRAEDATALLVTHDQSEALALGDSVALMREGRIVQQGTPDAVYRHPADPWVARFLGDSLIVEATAVDGGVARTRLGSVPVSGEGTRVLIRPDQLGVSQDGTETKVRLVEFRGSYTKVIGELSDGTRVVAHSAVPVGEGDVIRLSVTGEGWLLGE